MPHPLLVYHIDKILLSQLNVSLQSYYYNDAGINQHEMSLRIFFLHLLFLKNAIIKAVLLFSLWMSHLRDSRNMRHSVSSQ